LTDSIHRTRAAAALFAGVAISAMGYTLMVAYLPLAAEDILGDAHWSGLPSALGTVGTAFGTTWLSAIMLRRGRRPGLVLGYALAGVSAVLAAIGAASGIFPLLAAAIFFLGMGYSANRLSRYAAAELYEPSRRSSAIGWNVWAATLGSVVGPMLLVPVRDGTTALRLPEAMGPFLTAAVVYAVAGTALRLLFPSVRGWRSPSSESRPETPGEDDEDNAAVSDSGARLALAAMVVGQVVMVLIMTMTPIHIRDGGQGLQSIGIVIASHTFGMYAVSPLSGLLSDRVGRVPLIIAGTILLCASGLLAASAETGSVTLAFALFLLGLGWNFGFVAGSALLTESIPSNRRLRAQGIADSLVWGSAALASVGSGLLLAEVGYATLSRIGAVVSLVPIVFLLRRRDLRADYRADAIR
jgi:MFS family permease